LVLVLMGIIAYYQLSHGQTTTGDIVGCLTAAFSLKRPVRRIAASAVELQKSVAAIQRITWVQRNTSESHGEVKLREPVNLIHFDDVSFSYDGRTSVLKGIDLTLKKGQRVGVIGASGAGKSTLVDILLGFFPCSQGRVLIDDTDLQEIDPDSWRQQIGIVSQEPFLFDASIIANICYGNPGADADRVQEAINLSGCDEIIKRLPDGFDTRVGERGSLLSGGERKRVALARALIRPISILILDEATSELDPPNEAAILGAVDRLAHNLIVLNVSHRTSVLKHCDRVVLLADGRLDQIEMEDALMRDSAVDGQLRRKRNAAQP